MNDITIQQKRGIVLDSIRNNHPFGIIYLHGDYIVIAQDVTDLNAKIAMITRGDTKGFFTMEREIKRLGL